MIHKTLRSLRHAAHDGRTPAMVDPLQLSTLAWCPASAQPPPGARDESSQLATGSATARNTDSFLQSLLRWLPRERRRRGPDSAHMQALREACRACLQGLDGQAAAELQHGITRARGIQDLWYLRTALYNEVARALSQQEAERRLASLGPLLQPQRRGMPL